LHWSLFVFFKNPDAGCSALLEMWLQPEYINTIHAAAPWLLRYLAAAVVAQHGYARRSGKSTSSAVTMWTAQRDSVVRACRPDILGEAVSASKDALIEWMRALLIDFDFPRASHLFTQTQLTFDSDFFLNEFREDWLDGARAMLAEAYFKVYGTVSIQELVVNVLVMPREDGERWLVQLIRDARIDARLDFEHDAVRVAHVFPTVYQQVIEKTKGLVSRSHAMSGRLDKRSRSMAVAGGEM